MFRCFCVCSIYVFFFQAEDGIRDVAVTGVQTCALPISHVHVLVGKNGSSNVPTPKRPASAKQHWKDTLFQLRIHRLLLEDGWLLYNDVKEPVTVHGGDLNFSLDAGGTPEHPLYLGNLEWQTVEFASKRYMPLPVGATAKFTIWRDGFALEQGVLNAGHSRLDAQAEMSDFADPQWNYRYRGWVELLGFREIAHFGLSVKTRMAGI